MEVERNESGQKQWNQMEGGNVKAKPRLSHTLSLLHFSVRYFSLFNSPPSSCPVDASAVSKAGRDYLRQALAA